MVSSPDSSQMQPSSASWPPYTAGEGSPTPSAMQPLTRVPELSLHGIKEIGLNVPSAQLSQSLRFFEMLLQPSFNESSENSCVLGVGPVGSKLRISGLSESSNSPIDLSAPNLPGLRHLAFWVEGDIRVFSDKLTAKIQAEFSDLLPDFSGIDLQQFGTKNIAYFKGPGGVLLEIMQYKVPGAEASEPKEPRISRIDHVNIVTENLPEALDFFVSQLGFKVNPGKHARLQGPWIEKVTGLKDVDAYYIALAGQQPGTNLELIQYASPKSPSGERSNAPGLGLSSLALKFGDFSAIDQNLFLANNSIVAGAVRKVPDNVAIRISG